ncbi:MAG: LTA synthase family protein [Lachnospiraceae bacterium]|nr:LTA synthase family protein [Lachnospiraceae bacterium]
MKEQLKNYFKDIFKTKDKRMTLIAFIVLPFLCNIIVEMFNAKSFVEGITYIFRDTFSFFINVFIIMFTMSIGLLLKRRLAYMLTVAILWCGLGITNFIITLKRTTPFSATDFKLLGSIDDTIEKYLTPFEFIMIIVAIAMVVIGISMVWVKLPKYAEKISYFKNIIFIAISFGITFLIIELGFVVGALSPKFPNMTVAYADYGFPYCFVTSFVNKGVEQPEEYSEEAIREIVEKMNNTITVDEDETKTPNVIFLQMESFFDVSGMEGLELSAEATPIFNKLKEEYPSGYLTVNNVGYGTANTEFEIMTGLNLDDFGPGEFPYTTILTTTTCETTGYILKDYGYAAHAIHNNTATFYSRRSIFKRLGFDTFTSVEYMYPVDYTPTEWVKDYILTDEILKALNSTDEQDYIYAISVQGHGDYPSEPVLEEMKVNVTGGVEDESKKHMLEYYVNMLSEMDEFLGQLIEALSNLSEETVLVIYGDHLPSLDINESELKNKNLYQTEYVVWNNIDLEMDDKDIETYQLSSRVLHHIGIDGGMINKFHQTYNGDKDYLEKLTLLTFDILYGNMFSYDGVNPYIATDMKMGTQDIIITGIDKATYKEVYDYTSDESDVDDTTDDDTEEDTNISDIIDDIQGNNQAEVAPDWYLVRGNNFTKCSFVEINGIECDTIYVEPECLLIYAPELNSLDVLVVNQKSNATILSTSKEFTYFNVEDTPVVNPDEDVDSDGDNFGAEEDIDGDV